ncbi:MAG: SusC/RagA family TonB-linked outer membrane protein [Prolixibacteraceae bacterium]
MKLTAIMVFGVLIQVNASVYSQTKLNLDLSDRSIESILQEIENQSEYFFLYNNEQIDVTQKISVDVANKSVDDVLEVILAGTGIKYLKKDRQIALYKEDINAIRIQPNQQFKSISGRVADSSGSPLPGVSVVVKNTNNGTITDVDGRYNLKNIPANAILIFSFIGMRTQEMEVTGKTEINVVLAEETIGIEEVVAIGYGTVKREELTNAVSSISADDFVKGSVKDAAQLIKGQLAGVNIVNPDANPTGTSQIVLRGVTTLASGTQPLVVIDGVPGSLTDVAPEDIETIDVLKDGSAAAIYGTRGTNGVILITTKKVKGETPATIEWNSYITTQTITKTIDFMNASEYRALVEKGKPGAIDHGANTDWVDQIFRTPISHNHNLSMRGGRSNTNYIVNINYKELQGLMLRSDNNVLNARIEANHTMFDGKLKLNGSIIGYDQKYFSGGDGYSWREDVYRNALIYNPTDALTNESGKWTEHPEMNNYANPVSLIRETEGEIAITNFKPFGTISFHPISGLTLRALVSKDIYNKVAGYSESFDHINSIKEKRKGFASRGTTRTIDDLLELTSTYTKSFGAHNLNLLAGYSFQENMYEFYWMNNFDFPNDSYSYNNMSDGTALSEGKASMDSEKTSSKLVSYFARGNYSLGNRYMLMASLRYEGSSKFGKDHKWGAFPAVSLGWNMMNEQFMKDLLPSVNQIKIRAGFGITGTAPSSTYQSLSRLTYGNKILLNGAWIPVIYPSSNANPDLKWETKEEINLGLDFGIFEERVTGSIDVYKRTTKDLLWNYNVATPPYLYSSVLANAGSMENKGIEIQIKAIPIQTKQVNWTTKLNYSTNSNKLLSLSNEKFQLKSGYFYTGNTEEPIQTSTHRVEENKSIGNFYGFKSIDVDKDGFWIIEGRDGKPKPIAQQQPDDKKVLGNGLPKHYLSWDNTLVYKNFDLDITIRGAFSYQILNMTKMFYSVPISLTRGNVMRGTYDKVYGKMPLNDFQELQYVSYFIEDGDYWKIDNITVGYTFNIQRGPVKNLRLYVSGSNMFTITGYSGIDPEVNSLGLYPGLDQRDRYPSTRTFTFGASLKF